MLRLFRVFPEPVPDVSHRFNEVMFCVLNLAPESSYVDIYRPVATIIIIAPDLIEQSLAGIDPTPVVDQKLEQPVLPEGQFYLLTR